MATGTKETRKVWESLPLEMEAKKNVREKKEKKPLRQQQKQFTLIYTVL
jgi:hypothetical protein